MIPAIPRRSKRQQAKEFLRQIAIEMCGGLLHVGSKPYQLRESPTVVIAPHQDDETLACGGIIARKRNEGLPVSVIFITDGSASHPDHPRLDRRAIADLRAREAMSAMAYLGVERAAVHFLNEPDGTLNTITAERRTELVARLTKLLRAIGPAEVFLPCNPDGSSEHDASFGFVLDAIRAAGLRPDMWQYPVWSWWNPLLLFRRWLRTQDCRRQPVEDYQQAKRHAIDCYRSQVAPLAPDRYPALPADLVDIFKSDTEYFFRFPLPGATPAERGPVS
jgi:LmbE family N-acetylglucosaminyl deacetylase